MDLGAHAVELALSGLEVEGNLVDPCAVLEDAERLDGVHEEDELSEQLRNAAVHWWRETYV